MSKPSNQFIDEENVSQDFVSKTFSPDGLTFSVQLNLTGNFNLNAFLEASLDGVNFVSIPGMEVNGIAVGASPLFFELPD